MATVSHQRKPYPAGIPPLIAISIRQPWAELILRGIKTTEYRSRPNALTRRALIYASLSTDDLCECEIHELNPDELPRGKIVGSVTIHESGQSHDWQLSDPKRLRVEPIKPANRPQPIWFWPFDRPAQ